MPGTYKRYVNYHSILFGSLLTLLLVICLIYAVIMTILNTYWFCRDIHKPEEVNLEGVQNNSNFFKDLTLYQMKILFKRMKIERQEAIEYVNQALKKQHIMGDDRK